MADNLTPEARSRCMSRIRSRDTKPELIVRSIVHRLGYRFRLHRGDLLGRPDLVLTRHRAVIFVHGCFWHWHSDPNCPIAGMPKSKRTYWEPKLTRTRSRDSRNLTLLEAQGWRALTIWECELRYMDSVVSKVSEFLGGDKSKIPITIGR